MVRTAAAEQIVWVLILVILIEGLWLAGLTYLMWRRALKKKAEEEAAKEPTTST